ncbi:MAG: hypothetical protein NC925_04830 [Candidatus Omnitrophica bacterium]|nr:hypothetical protein [Candidatus Omnitrophota bacterium]MCM8831217.1 hypothetical protein [Candidatus Omnitrophota bacterium]
MEERFRELISFIYLVLKNTDTRYRKLFCEILDKLSISEKEIKKANIKDKDLKDILKAISWQKKIKKSLKETEPPQKVKAYMDKIINKAKNKAKEFFLSHTLAGKDFSLKNITDTSFLIIASREYFKEDKRIKPTPENIYKFEFSTYYDRKKEWLTISFSTSFKVEESKIGDISETNLDIFDDLAKTLGFSCGPDPIENEKLVCLDAYVVEKETIYTGTCDVEWVKNIRSDVF